MLKQGEVIPLIYDEMFKKVFAEKKENLKFLLEKILNYDIEELELLNQEMIAETHNKKKTVLDIVVRLKNQTKVNIEINTSTSTSLTNRNLIYLCRLISNDVLKESNYENLNKHIQINLDRYATYEKPISCYKIIETDTKEELTDKFEIIRIDIDYFKRLCYNKEEEELTLKEKLLGLIGINEKEKLEKVSKGDKLMEKIVDEINEYSSDKDFIEVYYKEDEMKRIHEGELIEAEMKGSNQAKTEIALKALENGASLEFISSITGLSIDEINKLKEE